MRISSTLIIALGLILFVISVGIGECCQSSTKKIIILDAKYESPVRAYLDVLKQEVER